MKMLPFNIVTRNGKIVWKHETSLKKSLCYVEIHRAAQNIGYHFKKTWHSLKGMSYLQVIFVLIWIKQKLIWLNLQRDGTGNGLSNIKYTFAPKYVHLQGCSLEFM